MIKDNTKLGSELSADDQKHALASFIHRFTGENRPEWSRRPRPCGSPYPVQFATDREWLQNTRFAVTRRGGLDSQFNCCHSTPTWPNNPELRQTK